MPSQHLAKALAAAETQHNSCPLEFWETLPRRKRQYWITKAELVLRMLDRMDLRVRDA